MSDLLTIREKNILHSLIQPHCTLIKTTVAQVLVAKEMGDGHLGWTCAACGVLCIIKDTSVDSYFLRLYCVKRAELLWEQELYIPFKYTASRTYFHTFPADGHQAGFNFANETEAEEFNFAVETVRAQQASLSFENIKERNSTSPESSVEKGKSLDCPLVAPQTKAKAALHLLKETDLDMALKKLFMQVHLTEEDLKNKSVSEIVDYIIKQFGGPEAVQRELSNRGSGSMTLPRASGSAISLAMKKGPLPRTPSFPGCPMPERTSHLSINATVPVRIRKHASVKDVSIPTFSERNDVILAALKEVFKKKQYLQMEENQSAEIE